MLDKTPQPYLVNVPTVLKDLSDLERQGEQAKTYEQLKKIIGRAKAIRVMHEEITQIRQEAEWTILVLRRSLGIRIDDVPKGNKHQFITDDKLIKRSDLPFKSATRARLLKLAKIDKKKLRDFCEDLWATEHDATMIAVLDELGFVDWKKERAAREKALAKKIIALPTKKYGVILADPEWRFKTHSDKGKVMTSAESHYPTSDLATIKKRKDVPKAAAKDCVLFLWATVPMLPQALEVMDAWGFNYVSNVAWDKEKTGTGYWFMNQHELLLVGTRGKVVPPAKGTQWPSLIRERARGHSEKPEKSYKLIEDYYPNIPKAEFNQRKSRPGWDGFGNEAP